EIGAMLYSPIARLKASGHQQPAGSPGETMLHSVDLSDYMLHNPPTIRPDADIFDAITMIIDLRISGLCVVDELGNLVGVLSELDCLEATFTAMYDGRRDVGRV